MHSALNRFIEGRVMGTATLESKLAQQLAVLPHDTLFQVFLDIHRTYNSLDRERCLEVLNGYGMRPNLTRLLKPYWERQRIAPKDSKFLGKEFRTGRGLTKGESASPMIFNIVVDAVLQAVLNVVCGPQEAQHGLGWAAGERNVIFYADDVRIAGRDHEWVQDVLLVTVAIF